MITNYVELARKALEKYHQEQAYLEIVRRALVKRQEERQLDSAQAPLLITAEQLRAAIVLWRYCENSPRFVFGDAANDAMADEILRQLRIQPEGMTRKEIQRHFQRDGSSPEITYVLCALQECGLTRMERDKEQEDYIRPPERWYAVAAF